MRAGNRSRGLLTAAAAVVLLAVCVLLTRSLWAPGQDGAARANVLALPVGVLSLVASMVSGWFAWRALQPAPQPRDAARELRDAVRSDRERFLSQALGMRYTVALARLTFADPEPGSLPAQAESLLLNWQDVDGAGAGSLDDVAARFGGRTRTLPSRWEPVAAAVRSDAPLLAVLENPWQLFLAVTAYADETSEPHELLSMSAPEVEDHLLARLVPAVVEQDPTLHARGWTADQVSSWLSGIAVHQQELAVRRDTSPTDLQFPDLWWMSGRRYPRTVPAVVAAMVGAAATVLFARGAVSGGTMGTAVVWWITTALRRSLRRASPRAPTVSPLR